MFCDEISWFYQDFKSENLFILNLHSVHTAKILSMSPEITLSPPEEGIKDLYNSKGFFPAFRNRYSVSIF